MRLISFLFLLTTSVVSACQGAEIADTQVSFTPRFETITQSEGFPVQVPSAFDSTRGWLVVQEDRSDAKSNEIKLPVAIIHSDAEVPKSPVLYLSGGPGSSAMRTAAFPGAYPWLKDRDFIVIGQRGTHYSKPALMCPEYRDAVESKTDRVSSVLACRERLEQAGIELENYNSEVSAADLDNLRTALGVKSWNLYGVSYGTRLALVYAKRFGQNLDSMVLDSPLPPNAMYDDQSAINLEQAIRSVAQDCAAQPSCNEAFPDLEQRFFQTIKTVSETPWKIDGMDEPITGADLASLLPLSSAADVRRAPYIMDQLARLDPVVRERLSGAPRAIDFAWGMRFSVWCSEALPFTERNRLATAGPTLGGYESAAIAPELCRAWGVGALEESAVAPVASDVPTLIVAGEFDPLTPPVWAELAAETLPNSLVAVARGDSHSVTQNWGGDGCAMALAANFIEAPMRVLETPKSSFCLFSRKAPEYALKLE